MRILIIILFSISVLISCQPDKKKDTSDSKSSMNIELKQKLEAILLKDQGIRILLDHNITNDKRQHLLDTLNISADSFKENKYKIYEEYDSANLSEIEQIFKEYGYPGKELVGRRASIVPFLVIQHSDKIEEYLPLIKSAGERGDISATNVATMEDRYLMEKGEKQIYGTQLRSQQIENGEMITFVWPIENPDSVNALRESLGFKKTIEEYVKQFGIEYKDYTLEEVNEIIQTGHNSGS